MKKKKLVQRNNATKMQKGRIKGTEINRRLVKTGSFAIKSLGTGRISEFELEAARKAIKRIIKRKGKLILRVKPYQPLTKKSAGVRMGKGKGKVNRHVYPIKPGKVILELINNQLLFSVAKKILSKAVTKFSVPVSIIKLKD